MIQPDESKTLLTRKSVARTSLLLLVTLFFCTATACRESGKTTSPATSAKHPNILLISVDTLRPDHLSCYGYTRPTSPNIDRLATAGALFETAISSTSWTLPAHAALMTGLSDSVHGCVDTDRRLADSRRTLAERLKRPDKTATPRSDFSRARICIRYSDWGRVLMSTWIARPTPA